MSCVPRWLGSPSGVQTCLSQARADMRCSCSGGASCLLFAYTELLSSHLGMRQRQGVRCRIACSILRPEFIQRLSGDFEGVF